MQKEFDYLNKNNNWFPVIDIILCGPKRIRTFKALIDSGATFSVFRAEVAKFLGIEIGKGKEIYLEGIGGRILGYLHNLKISVDGKNFFRCKIVFSSEFNVSFNLLGRDNFFLPFIISFLEKNKKIIIQTN
ncbi:retroviral-like aspartic protease family protein [Patescibacteria group bacterium]|nr:retroviral-like aspartic protease family protein [Patescibacteria group bacterium]MBU4481181.1 retroviral-like aspartic protease family protein [Patescibacteria group bacterium]